QLPAWSDVMAVLEARGVSAAGWPADAQEVMRSPQGLATYLQLTSRYSSEPFMSYQAMLERLWVERVLVGDNGPRRDQLATDINAYHGELEAIWRAVDLRAHLRVLLIDLLGAQAKPTDREALLLETALTRGNMRLRGFRALSGSEGWFARFGKSFIAEAMVT